MKNKTTIIKTFNNCLLLLFIVTILLYGFELVSYFLMSDQYRFGTEVAGWRYFSTYHYIGSIIIELLLFTIGAFAGMFFKKISHIIFLRSFLLLFLITVYFS